MKLATRLKISIAVFLLLAVCSCLFVPITGAKQSFLGYHPIWQRPAYGTIDQQTVQIEWFLILAFSAALFFLLEALLAVFAFLKQRKLLLITGAVLLGIVSGWWLVSTNETQLNEFNQAEAAAESSTKAKVTGLQLERQRRVQEHAQEQALQVLTKRAQELRTKLYQPRVWTSAKLSPLNATANLQTQMQSSQVLSYCFWYAGNPEDIEEAIAHFGDIHISLQDAELLPAINIQTDRSKGAWVSRGGKRAFQISGTIYCTENQYASAAKWKFE